MLGTAAKDGRVFTSEEETTFRMLHKTYNFFHNLILVGPGYVTLSEETSINNPCFNI